MSELTNRLAASVEALEAGGRFVWANALPSESELNAVHAELARVIRSNRVLRVEVVLPMPEVP